jgi:hypothetical protein
MFSVAPLFLPKGPVKTAGLWRLSVPDIILRWGDRKRRSERCNPGPRIELAGHAIEVCPLVSPFV